ncbi:hypothetical protein HY771_02395 [Candidatus Uhrbacteria bacterium]|nr:hypothetical protein [Candidatus Uhrbacteria bacterium]
MKTGIIVIGLIVLFIASVIWFRQPKDTVEDRIDSIADVLSPDPVSQAVLNGAIDTESKSAQLFLVETTSEEVGQARRGTKDGRYFFETKARLSEIDREVSFYNVWLVRQIPYGYFALGEMITNDDGDFILEWESQDEKDYFEYTKIIITLQKYGESADPQEHVAEGVFGG